ncbi:MAG: hypothetical protein ACREN4_01175, partial [Candidatus Dormibacteria bacterium]
MAAAQGEVPKEVLTATPPSVGVVGVPVQVRLRPAPVEEFATINVAEPDVGDGDPGETLHVTWVVEAAPDEVVWHWPDGTTGGDSEWVPQTYEQSGSIAVSVIYDVTASGFWSDGLTVHTLPSVAVGTITVEASLPYSVEQVQPSL